MLKLDKIQANKIVEKLMADIPYNINIMDERGKIIASGDSARIGERHRGAERAINERKNIEIYKDTSLEKKGTNEPIILNDHILGVVGISGEPDEVRKFTDRRIKYTTRTRKKEETKKSVYPALNAC